MLFGRFWKDFGSCFGVALGGCFLVGLPSWFVVSFGSCSGVGLPSWFVVHHGLVCGVLDFFGPLQTCLGLGLWYFGPHYLASPPNISPIASSSERICTELSLSVP